MSEEGCAENKGGLAPVSLAPITVSEGDFKEMEPNSSCLTYKKIDEILQDENLVTQSHLTSLTNAVSRARLQRYVDMANGDQRLGVRLHHWNAALGGALLPTLQLAEVTIRNVAMKRLISKYGSQWYLNEEFVFYRLGGSSYLANELKSTVEKELARERKGLLSDYITSELMFGFWVHMFTSKFHPHLWRQPLHTILPNIPRDMDISALHTEVEFVRTFRNNVAHHKDLTNKPLMDDYNRTLNVIYALSPRCDGLAEKLSAFPKVWACDPR